MIHRHIGREVINGEAIGDIVSDDAVAGQGALMGLAADGHERLAVPRHGQQAVRNDRVVDNPAVMNARKENAPTRAGHHNVVRYGHVRPFLVKGVDALQISRERELRVRLSDGEVAVDEDVREVVIGDSS